MNYYYNISNMIYQSYFDEENDTPVIDRMPPAGLE